MSSRRSSATQSRSQFLDELDARLRILPAEELRAAILGHAERLAPRDRRAFLAIFPAAAPGSRPHGRLPRTRLLEELRQFEYVGGLITLEDIAGTRREGLADLEPFLPDWLRQLAAAPRDWLRSPGRSLLVEAARLHRGIDGLADLARATVANLPQLMLDWVDALVADGREDDAMAACRDGLERVETGGAAARCVPSSGTGWPCWEAGAA